MEAAVNGGETECKDLFSRIATAGARIYLIGAGGCGMSGLGHLLLDLGCRVFGSDHALNAEARQLIARGADIRAGHDPEHLRASASEAVVFSSAISPENPQRRLAGELGLPSFRRGTALAGLVRLQTGICVAGMHGKTTTSALLAFALRQLGADPSFAVGATVPQFVRHAQWSQPRGGEATARTPYFVVEADESDGTLRHFHPEHAIILNLDEEHLDYYGSMEAVREEFRAFARRARGRVVFSADDAELCGLLDGHGMSVSYGCAPAAAYQIRHAERMGPPCRGSRFEIWKRGELFGRFETALMGEKNVSNAAAVIALLSELGFASDRIAGAIRHFTGASRRQELLFENGEVRIFDDYGHHPNEIRATLQALRGLEPRRLLVAFQPHRYTRTQQLRDEFATCFGEADRLWLTDIYAASEPPIPGVSGETLVRAVREHGKEAAYIGAVKAIPQAVAREVAPGDIVLFLGAGDITVAAHELAAGMAGSGVRMKRSIAAELRENLSADSVVREQEDLSKRTTLRVGGSAEVYVEPASEEDLSRVLKFCQASGIPFFILGRGSNLLIRDGGVRGVVICLAHPVFSRVIVNASEGRIWCGAGAKLKAVAVEARRHSLAGLEFLEGIPGSVGGGLRMNAGAMGSSMFEAVELVRSMDLSGEIHEHPVSEIPVRYRSCPFLETRVALGTVLRGQPGDPAGIAARMAAFSRKRWDSQPAFPSAGCIFKNPPEMPAGKLIEQLGLKGTQIGRAAISDVHGNFMVNLGGAKARDVLDLIELVKDRARRLRGIDLETEVEILGDESETIRARTDSEQPTGKEQLGSRVPGSEASGPVSQAMANS